MEIKKKDLLELENLDNSFFEYIKLYQNKPFNNIDGDLKLELYFNNEIEYLENRFYYLLDSKLFYTKKYIYILRKDSDIEYGDTQYFESYYLNKDDFSLYGKKEYLHRLNELKRISDLCKFMIYNTINNNELYQDYEMNKLFYKIKRKIYVLLNH